MHSSLMYVTSVIHFQHDRGIGVVGLQPAIFPKSSFEYSSACPLSTQNGRMVSFVPSMFFYKVIPHIENFFLIYGV